jgi:predicted phosphodiesterase
VDGVICGHIHHATVEDIGTVRYINAGDWVESCTAVAEDFDGNFSIIRWDNIQRQLEIRTARTAGPVEKLTGRAARMAPQATALKPI